MRTACGCVCVCDISDSSHASGKKENSKDISCFLTNERTFFPFEPSFPHLFDVIIFCTMLIYTVLWLLWCEVELVSGKNSKGISRFDDEISRFLMVIKKMKKFQSFHSLLKAVFVRIKVKFRKR